MVSTEQLSKLRLRPEAGRDIANRWRERANWLRQKARELDVDALQVEHAVGLARPCHLCGKRPDEGCRH